MRGCTRTPLEPRGPGGWILTAKMAFFGFGFAPFRWRVSSRQPPVSPDGDDVASRLGSGVLGMEGNHHVL
jgi:hypothetical protein